MRGSRPALITVFLAVATTAGSRQDQPFAARRIAAGTNHTCAITVDGRTLCWGDNRKGQSAGGASETNPAISVPGPELVEIAAGGRHSCGLDREGMAWCWGDNSFGQLGNGARTRRDVPTAVKGGLRYVAISAGDSHTCALGENGQAWCWGDQWDRAAGAFSAGDNLTEPFPVKGGQSFNELATGGHHTCGVTRERDVWCWGNNAHGQVSPDTRWNAIDYPVQVADLPPARTIRAGAAYSCALAVNGSIHCWGSLTDDSTSIRSVEAPDREFIQIATGARHICARTTDEETYCWGENRSNQIGPAINDWIENPMAVPAVRSFSSLSAGAGHTCGLDSHGLVYCWGSNSHGQLGQPADAETHSPRPVRQAGRP